MTIRGVEEAMLKKKARNTCFFVQKSQNNAFFHKVVKIRTATISFKRIYDDKGDSRLISFCNTLYQCITKILILS